MKKIDFRTPENAKKLADALSRHFGPVVAKMTNEQVKAILGKDSKTA